MCSPGFADHPRFGAPPRALARLLLLGVVLLFVAGCRTYPVAEDALRTGIAVNAGHAKDPKLAAEARAIAQDNEDLMWKVLFAIGGCEEKDIPAEVRARQAARKGGGQ